jgi:hypothetical protein
MCSYAAVRARTSRHGVCLAPPLVSRHPVRLQRAEIVLSDHFSPSFHRSFGQRLRSWFFTGLVVFGPVAVTAYIAWWVIDTIEPLRLLAEAILFESRGHC